MLEQASPLNRSMLHSALKGQSRLRPKGASGRKNAFTSLMLTSLVDAFSILVIFLIVNNASSQETLNYDGKVKLPAANHAQLIEKGVVVRVEGNVFVVNEQRVGLSDLAAQLKAAKGDLDEKKDGVIIVADKKLDFADISPVIAAGSNAGFIKFKFAVQRKDE